MWWLLLLLGLQQMAGNGPTTLVFSNAETGPWQRVSANGTMLGLVPETPREQPAGCYGMGRLADGTIWAACERHFYTVDPTLMRWRGGTIPVETIAGQSARQLYRIRRGPKLPLKRPQVEHTALLEAIDPRTWTLTRAWTLPGTYRSYGRGQLAVDPSDGVAYYTKETSSGIIHRHDLTQDRTLPDLVARSVGSGGLLVLPSGSILVGYRDGVQRFAPDGTLERTYEIGPLRSGQGLLAHGATGASFWVQGFAEDAVYSTLYELDVETGEIRHQWNTPANGVRWDAPFVDPPTACIPRGSLAFTFTANAPDKGPVVYLSSVNGSLLGISSEINHTGQSDVLDDGTFAVTDFDEIFSPCPITKIGDYVHGTAGGTPVRGNYTDRFYAANVVVSGNARHFRSVDKTGAVIWTSSLVPRSMESLAPSPDNAIIYYGAGGGATTAQKKSVYRYDVVNDVDLGAWVTEATRQLVPSTWNQILTLRNGDVLVGWSGASSTTSVVKHYAPDGTELHAYPLGGNNEPFILAAALDDQSFWVTYYGSAEYSTLDQIRITDGAQLFHKEFTNAEISAIDAEFSILFQPDLTVFVTREDCNCAMACPDPCEHVGLGEPYFALLPEGFRTYFYDRAWTLFSTFPAPSSPFVGQPGVALAASSEGVWIAYDEAGGASVLYLVDPATIDGNDGLPLAKVIRGPILTEVRIGELGGAHALFVLTCDRLLTVDRGTHELIELCLPFHSDPDAAEGIALVGKRYSLVVDPLDAQLVDGGKNLLYLDAGVAKVWNLKNDALLRTVGDVGGIWPTVLSDNTFLVFTGTFRTHGDVLRYKRSGTLLRRYTYDHAVYTPGVWNLAAERQTDACSCGNGKQGAIFLPGEDPKSIAYLPLLDLEIFASSQELPDIIEGSVDTASAFIIIGATDVGSGFSDQSGSTVRRPSPNRHCGPEARLSTVQPNPGCNAGGRGWTPSYTGASGVVPTCTDPTLGETLTGKTSAFVDVEIPHESYPAGSPITLRLAKVELDDTQRKEGLLFSIGDDDRGLSDGQGNMQAGSTTVQIMEGEVGRIRALLASASQKYFTRNELSIRVRSDEGRRSGATARQIGRGLIYGEDYGSPLMARFTAVDPLFVDGGSFSPDKRVPQHTYPLSYYTDAPPDLAQLPMPIIYGEVSDEGAISPITGLPNSRGKCPLRYVGRDILGTVAGGEEWGRFNLCRHAVYSILGLYGSDLGALGLYGRRAVASVLAPSESEDEEVAAGTAETTLVTLDGAPDLSGVATDGTMQIVLWLPSGRTEAVITAVDAFANTVAVENQIDPTLAAGVPWYISSIDYVPRRVKIDLATRNGVDVQVPTQPGYVRATPYYDFTSLDGDYRVCDVHVLEPLLSAHLAGEVTLAANVIGVEDKGDGSGLPIVDYFTAYNHFWDNFVHRQVQKPSAAGTLWPQVQADLPLWSDGLSKTKQSTFAAAQAQTATALGGYGLRVSAYFGDGLSMRDAIQLWNDNGGCRTYVDEYGRVGVWRLDPYADTSAWPRVDHVDRVFGTVRRWRALDEAMNVVRGGCDWDPDGQAFREDDLTATATEAITRNAGIRRYSKHLDGKLIANRAHFEALLLQGQLALNQDGPIYVSIENGDLGLLDYPIGSGVVFYSLMLPEGDAVGVPLIILHRTFHIDSHLVSLICLDVSALVVGSAQQFILTNNVSGPILSNDTAVTPVLVAA